MHTRRLATVVAVATTLLIGPFAGMALAHVHVDSPGAAQGGAAEISFGVPTEKDVATVKVEIALPTDTPILGVTVPAMDGWTSSVVTEPLPTPVTAADGTTVTDMVSRVVWTTTGPGIAPEQRGEFVIDAGVLPAVDQVVFKALQTYQDGSVVSWIQEEVEGAPEPDYPAPVLELAEPEVGAQAAAAPPVESAPAASSDETSTAATSSAALTTSSSSVSPAAGAAAASSPTVAISTSAAATTQAASEETSSSTTTIVIIAVVVLLAAVGGLLFLRRRRSTL